MLTTAVVFFAILSILVLIHELGHFLVARFVGVDVEEFGLGLPPRLLGKKIKSTIYSLNWLPIGGFVKLAGEDDGEHIQPKGKVLFWQKSKKARAAILTAGVFMNFFLAVSVTAFLLTTGIKEPTGLVRIESVAPGSPASAAGLQVGDIINSFKTPQELIEFTKSRAGAPITLTVVTGELRKNIILTPRANPPPGQGPMGVSITDLETRVYSWSEAPQKALVINLSRAWEMLKSLGILLWRLITFQPLAADVAGPIGIAQVTGEAVRFGWKAVLEFASILSLNLAVLNILPIPALDGGRLAFVFLEKILGRRVKPAFEKSTHQIGMIILFMLILLVSIHDILRLVRG